jgi:hypothetical protein
MSGAREPTFFASGGAASGSGAFIPPAPASRASVEARAEAAGGPGNGLRAAEGEGQLGRVATLISRVMGGGSARAGKPDAAAEQMKHQPRFGGGEERQPSQAETDLLDIPAFLRRQAN